MGYKRKIMMKNMFFFTKRNDCNICCSFRFDVFFDWIQVGSRMINSDFFDIVRSVKNTGTASII